MCVKEEGKSFASEGTEKADEKVTNDKD